MFVTRKRYLIENLSLSWNKNQNEQKWVKGRLVVVLVSLVGLKTGSNMSKAIKHKQGVRFFLKK